MKLNLGCGDAVVDGWINVDYAIGARLIKLPLFGFINRALHITNRTWDKRILIHDLTTPFPWQDAEADAIYCSHTFEHFTRDQGRMFLARCHRVLRLGGTIRIIVPDLRAIVDQYNTGEIPADKLLDRLSVLYSQFDSRLKTRLAPFFQFPHKCMYDSDTLMRAVHEAGFDCIKANPFESKIPNIDSIERECAVEKAIIVEGTKG